MIAWVRGFSATYLQNSLDQFSKTDSLSFVFNKIWDYNDVEIDWNMGQIYFTLWLIFWGEKIRLKHVNLIKVNTFLIFQKKKKISYRIQRMNLIWVCAMDSFWQTIGSWKLKLHTCGYRLVGSISFSTFFTALERWIMDYLRPNKQSHLDNNILWSEMKRQSENSPDLTLAEEMRMN